MKELVLDCSVTLAWGFPSEATPDTDNLFESFRDGAVAWVPALWRWEVTNVLLLGQRRGRISAAKVEAFLGLLGTFAINLDLVAAEQAWGKTLGLAEQYGLTTYDAAYMELALRRNLPLATLDSALCTAMKKAGGKLVW